MTEEEFVESLVDRKYRAGPLKLYRTVPALDEAPVQVGDELQERRGGEAARMVRAREEETPC